MHHERRALEGPPLPPLSPAPHAAMAEPEPPSRGWIGWLILLCIVGGAYLLHRRMEQQAKSPVFSPARTARARVGALERNVRVTGTTAASKYSYLIAPKLQGTRGRESSELTLTLVKLATPGMKLRKGDVVAEFDRQFMNIRVDDYRSNVLQWEQNLIRLRASLDLRRYQQQLKVKRAKAQMEKAALDLKTAPVRSAIQTARFQMNFDQAKAQYEQYLKETPDVDASELASIRRYELEVEEAKQQLRKAQRNADDMTYRAPHDGVLVLRRNYRNGEFVEVQEGESVGPGSTFAEVTDTASIVMHAVVNQVDADLVKNGAQAEVNFDAYPGLKLPARVVSVGAVTAPAGQRAQYVRSVPLRLAMEGHDERVIPNLTASADILIEREENAVIVPLECVFRDRDGTPYALVQAGGEWQKRDLELGCANHVEVAVQSGIKDGELIAAEPR
ncbi:MAG: efflux RND transporter periplasmic adaptor subunit [Bryobacterales bacterium]|nr:efflux RND transporter periplasmic adaptor subunit [Bryobacterales bacterium]